MRLSPNQCVREYVYERERIENEGIKLMKTRKYEEARMRLHRGVADGSAEKV